MSGRPKKQYGPLYRPVYLEMPNSIRILLATILVTCPACGSALVGTFGTKPRKDGRVENFRCHNPACPHRKIYKGGKQFVLTTSQPFKQEIWKTLQGLYEDLLRDGDKACSVAKKYHVSEPEVSALRAEVTAAIEDHRGLDQLVPVPQPDTAIAIDETFLKVEGKTLFVIIATGYTTHKALGVRVSATRKEEDMRAVFDQAEAQMEQPTEILLTDGLNAYQGLARDLGRPITHAIHIHKPPYTRLVIRRITYDADKTHREELTFATKTNILVRRGKREVHFILTKKYVGPPRKRGRKKGQKKAGQTKHSTKAGTKSRKSKNKKRGPKYGLGTLHKRGTKAYVKVDPYRHTITGIGPVPPELVKVVQALQAQFGRKHVVNNISEYGINQYRRGVPLTGPQSQGGVEASSSIFFRVKNGNLLDVPPDLAGHFSPRLALRGMFPPPLVHLGKSLPTFKISLKGKV